MGQPILELFFENPTRNYHIREISRILGISKTAVAHHVNKFVSSGIVLREETGVFTSYRANEVGELYRFHKRQFFLEKILKIGLLDYLETKVTPRCIVLFGSFAKAEYDKDSDVDIFVQAADKKVNLLKYEKKLGHRINLFFEPDLKKMSKELLNNIVNGVKLRGYIKL